LEHMRTGGKVRNNYYNPGVYFYYDPDKERFMQGSDHYPLGIHACVNFNAETIYSAEWTAYEAPKPKNYRFAIDLAGDITGVTSRLQGCTAAEFAGHLRRILNSVGFPDGDIKHIQVFTPCGDNKETSV
jgi:hypothetical protein